MTDLEFDILRSAVNLAKTYQIPTVDALRARLRNVYPNEEAAIDGALNAWSEYVRSNPPDYIRSHLSTRPGTPYAHPASAPERLAP